MLKYVIWFGIVSCYVCLSNQTLTNKYLNKHFHVCIPKPRKDFSPAKKHATTLNTKIHAIVLFIFDNLKYDLDLFHLFV
jgi:hypothetical protein